MSKTITVPKLIIDGDDFLPNSSYSATVEQSQGGHSAFSISFQSGAVENHDGDPMENAIELIGKRMSIGLDDGAMEFTGLVDSVDLHRGTSSAGTLVVSGHGPSVLLANSVQCTSYEEGMPLSFVAEKVLEGHSTELLKAVMGAGTDVRLPYTVQYNESDLSFLQRLCRRYGLWFYHNGRDYCIGRSGSEQIGGTYGVDVTDFGLSTALRGRGPEVSGHDWTGDGLLESPSSLARPESGHPCFHRVKKESDLNFQKRGRYDHTSGQHEHSGQGGMDTATTVTALATAAGMVTASGSSRLVALRVGDILALKANDPDNTHTYGSYDIVKIVHSFDHGGRYRNRFEGIPADTDHPPGSDGFAVPFSPDQRGRVLDNADPMGLGRVRVQFEWQREISQSTPWIKTSTPYAGSGRGLYFVPEKGEEVLVGFQGGNPEKPYVMASGYNANEKSGFADSGNNIKAIRTRSGHTIELNDTDGEEEIHIYNKDKKNMIVLSSKDKNIRIVSEGDILMQGKNIQLTAEESILMEAKEKEISLKANEKISAESKDITLKAVKDIVADGKEIALKAKTKVDLKGGSGVDVNSPRTKIQGNIGKLEIV